MVPMINIYSVYNSFPNIVVCPFRHKISVTVKNVKDFIQVLLARKNQAKVHLPGNTYK